MTKEQIKKSIKKEMAEIKKEHNVAEWEMVDVDDMDSNEAFNRGYYRALQACYRLL